MTNTKTPKTLKKIAFNEDQKNAMRVIHEVPITLITGQAGVGKSLVAIHTALKMLKDKTVDKIMPNEKRAFLILGKIAHDRIL